MHQKKKTKKTKEIKDDMVSFCTLWENMEKTPSEKDKVSEKAFSVIKTGTNIEENFWENFLRLLNNTSGVSELFDVSPEKISKWNSQIRIGLKQLEKETEDLGKNKKLI